MKQNQSNWITEFFCNVTDKYMRQIPEGYAIFRYPWKLIRLICSAGTHVKSTKETKESAKKIDDSSSHPALPSLDTVKETDFVKKVSLTELPADRRCWTGNDANKRNHHGRIPAGENPVYMELHWKKNKNAQKKLVGGFVLDVAAMEREGYLTRDSGGSIRLRFIHESDGQVYIGNKTDEKIPIGKVLT
uniref:Uncharacterized protein n=1 Tax=Candidatus Kentrum sp. TUN TaxID=2126343 RepID=A0A450ZGX0_9GAMM|nr:MAG: hypothetical protein BECKTUN1418D_GA0071000_101619 [Candidatus Kentron sp. TUN]VFK52978.1 MAG: hypothetical protein BECKTUN1418F_GA0071002_101527 [Candidatus Kentron sp. TUN]VFK53518.1 MAG: hypothetical protein BECKTUN1418E_GA0071001_101728 [Candidatus Kentron sp. TUN]